MSFDCRVLLQTATVQGREMANPSAVRGKWSWLVVGGIWWDYSPKIMGHVGSTTWDWKSIKTIQISCIGCVLMRCFPCVGLTWFKPIMSCPGTDSYSWPQVPQVGAKKWLGIFRFDVRLRVPRFFSWAADSSNSSWVLFQAINSCHVGWGHYVFLKCFCMCRNLSICVHRHPILYPSTCVEHRLHLLSTYCIWPWWHSLMGSASILCGPRGVCQRGPR